MGINIQTGTPPAIRVQKSRTTAIADSVEAAKKLKAGQWFIVPETAGKTPRANGRKLSSLRKRIKDLNLTLVIGHLDDNGGVIVRLPSELERTMHLRSIR